MLLQANAYGVDVYKTGTFFLKQEKYKGTCALTSFLNARADPRPALTVKDCNFMRMKYERATPNFIPYQFGGKTGWWPLHIVFQAAKLKGLGARRLNVGADFSVASRRMAKVIQAAIDNEGDGLLVLLGRPKVKGVPGPDHVIAIRDNVVYDGEFDLPVPIALYPNLKHARRMYVLYDAVRA